MLIIGERINGMFAGVGEAISRKDADFIQSLARLQVEAGSCALDVCVGPVKGDAPSYMEWLVKTVASVTEVPLCIDSPHPEVLEAGVKAAAGRKTMINSIKLSEGHVKRLIPLAAGHGCDVICLLMSDRGIPADADGKLEIAAELLTAAMEGGVAPERIYFDPILLPVANAQKDVAGTFELMDSLRMLTSPAPHLVVGLSNLSQRAAYRSLLNRTYCVMAMSHGLDAAILDPLDEKLVKSVKTAQILLNRELYARSYLKF